ncbi:MAG: NIPSNAP family protein [Pseudomonadota bacterium]
MGAMVHELVADFFEAGGQAGAVERLKAAQATRRQKLIAAWTPEYGLLNRLTTLWEGDADALPPGAGADPDTDWMSSASTSHVLVPRRPVRMDQLAAPILELRTYAMHEGRCETFVNALLTALPHREKYSLNAGVWTTRERGVDLVYHLWTYESLAQRMAARDGAMKDEGWSIYRASIRPLLRGLKASLLTPVKL